MSQYQILCWLVLLVKWRKGMNCQFCYLVYNINNLKVRDNQYIVMICDTYVICVLFYIHGKLEIDLWRILLMIGNYHFAYLISMSLYLHILEGILLLCHESNSNCVDMAIFFFTHSLFFKLAKIESFSFLQRFELSNWHLFSHCYIFMYHSDKF